MPERSVRFALGALDAMIAEEADAANAMAVAFPQAFEQIGAASGIGIRLQALTDARQRIVAASLRDHEAARD